MSNLILAHIVCHSYKPPNSIMQTIEKTRKLNMFNNLRFMMVLDNFLFPSPLDLKHIVLTISRLVTSPAKYVTTH